MSVLFDQETAQYALDCDYELNTVSLSETTRMHTHQFIELVYTLSGTGIHWIDGKQYHVKSGDMLWINYRSQHTVEPTDKLRYMDIMLKPEYVNQTLQGTEDLFLLLQLLIRGDRKPHQEAVGEDITYQALTARLGADSVTCYHMAQLAGFKSVDYETQMNAAESVWKQIDAEYTIPFFPNVACGWDNCPRRVYKPKIVTGNTPDKVETALWHTKEYIDTHPLPVNLITVNSWNEWTEGGYLEPDDLYGYGYLDAVKRVFKDTQE